MHYGSDQKRHTPRRGAQGRGTRALRGGQLRWFAGPSGVVSIAGQQPESRGHGAIVFRAKHREVLGQAPPPILFSD